MPAPGLIRRQSRRKQPVFVLVQDPEGTPHVRAFRATVDPGGSRSRNVQERLRRGRFQVQGQQQYDYILNTNNRSKFGRPTFTPAMRDSDDAPIVDDGNAERRDTIRRVNGRGARDEHDGHHASLRVTNDAGVERMQTSFFALHSGGSGGATGDLVNGDSTGCQVVMGSWYGSFVETIRRGILILQGREGDELSTTNRERVRYTLIDGELMERTDACAPGSPGNPGVPKHSIVSGENTAMA